MKTANETKPVKTVIVTGGAGFLGSNLCEYLLSKNERVICVDNLYTGRIENIKHLLKNKKFRFIKHDIIKPFMMKEKIDQIYNLACPASPPHYQKDPIMTIKTNTIGIINVLELARKNNARILQASTSEVYGDPKEHPQKESYRGNVNPDGPRACYDEGKRIGETLFFDYNRKYKTQIKVIRIFNTYGPQMDPKDGRVVSNFIIQALKNQPITVYGKGDQTRSFCYVSDLIEGIYLMMNNSDFQGPVNLGNPGEYTVLEIAKLIKKMTNSKSQIVFEKLPVDDPCKRKPDITIAKNKLGWQPKVSLEQGLVKTIEYFKMKK